MFHGENDGSILDEPNALLRFASLNVTKSPSAAKRAYLDAIGKYTALSTPDPAISVRKLRSLTAAELGLTLVVQDTDKHLRRAQRYSDSAFASACRSPDPHDKLRVRLDKGNIKAREARVKEKARTSAMVVNSIVGEAFDAFQIVVTELGLDPKSVDDYNTLAQALLGCARVAGKLQGVLAGPGRRVLPKDTYLKEALERVEKGLGLGTSGRQGGAEERLMETMGVVRDMMRQER